MSIWVQHKSGIGEKWGVSGRSDSKCWYCAMDVNDIVKLPKSEYIEVPAPEPPEPLEWWVNVTEQCVNIHNGNIMHGNIRLTEKTDFTDFTDDTRPHARYRLRKVEYTWEDIYGRPSASRWAFIVEKKETA